MSQEQVLQHFRHHQQTIDLVSTHLSAAIVEVAGLLATAIEGRHKVLIAGNGGSAADAQHFAAELVGRYLCERPGLPALALTTDTSILTAVGNDYGFEAIFSRQVEALAVPGDVVVGISTSGGSENVYQALLRAREIGCKTIGLLGRDGGKIAKVVDIDLTVPVQETPFIQEAHAAIIHILCQLVEERFAKAHTAQECLP